MTFKESIAIVIFAALASLFALFVLIRLFFQKSKNWWRDEEDD